MDINAYVLSKKYTDDSMEGAGAVAGKPCQIQSITDITGGHRVTFLWVDNAGTSHTSVMDVKDGTDAVQISNIVATDDNKIKVIMADGTEYVTTEIPTVQGEEGKSAYEVAVEQGYTGTEEEWLASLKGDKGDAGEGVPTGGTTGQVLVKKSSTDYDTEWDTPAGGGDMLKSVYDTDNDGKVDSAENADTVGGHTVAKDVPADAKFTDTVYDDTEIRGDIADKVDKVTGKGLSTNDYSDADKAIVDGVTSALAGKADVADLPSKTSDLTNDSGFITKAVNDLVNYYLKSETYSKTEVDDIVTAIKNSRFEVVATLPTTDIKTNVIYLVPKSPSQTSNVKDEYINLDGTTSGWEKIGDTEIDLSDYVTTQALNTALAAYTTTADLTTLLAAKQDTLTFDDAPTENSNNPVKSGGVYTANQKLYKLDAAYGVKNLAPRLKSQTINNVTFDINNDGSITVNGTAASDCWYDICGQDINNFLQAGENYIASGCPEGGSDATFFMYIGGTYLKYVVDDTSFTCDAAKSGHFYICVRTNTVMDNVVFYPMIRHASYVDDTYQPYAKTNKQLTDDAETLTNQANDMVNVLGAKNLIPYPYSNTTKTVNGITCTDNGNGTVTLNGTSTDKVNFWCYLYGNDYMKLDKGTYIISASGNAQIACSVAYYMNNTWKRQVNAYEEDEIFTINTNDSSYNNIGVVIYIPSGSTLSNFVVKPMIRLASIQDDTYVPYVPTNKELMSCKLNGYVGAKNLLPYPYYHTTKTENGLTITDNGDGTVAIAGTATSETTFYLNHTNIGAILGKGSYVLSGCPTDGNRASGYFIEISGRATSTDSWTVLATDIGEGAAFTVTEAMLNWVAMHLFIRVRSGKAISSAITFKPMLRHIEDTDDTYVTYAKTNQQLTKETTALLDNTEVNGAVNMLPNNGTSQTLGDGHVTFTVNNDGTVTATADGQQTSNVELPLYTNSDGSPHLVGKTVKLSGCPSGGSTNTYSIQAYRVGAVDGSTGTSTDNGDGTEFTWLNNGSGTKAVVKIIIRPSYNGTVTFKPMITVPSYNGDYVPYAKSNKELTDDVTSQEIAITPNSDYVSSSSVHVYKVGKLRFLEGYFFTSKDVPQHTVLFTVDAKPLSNNTYLIFAKGDGTFYLGKVDSNKQIQLDSTTSMSQGAYAIIGSYLVE